MSTYVNIGNKKTVPVNGNDCYFSIGTGLLISKDGKTVALNNFGKVGDILPVLQDASGPYVINKDEKRSTPAMPLPMPASSHTLAMVPRRPSVWMGT